MASTTNQQPPLDCPLCPRKKIFDNRASLAQHYYEKHSASYCCQYCVQQFTNVEKLKKHIEVSHLIARSLCCVMCDYRTSKGKKRMGKHMRWAHRPAKKKTTCNTCETVFHDQQCLQIHTNYCRGEEQRRIRTWRPKKSLDKKGNNNLQHQSAANVVGNVSHIATSVSSASSNDIVHKAAERRALLPTPAPAIILCLCCFKRVPIADFLRHLEHHVVEKGESVPCNECFKFLKEMSGVAIHLACFVREAVRWCQFSAGNSPYLLCACGFCASRMKQMRDHEFWCHLKKKCRMCDADLIGKVGLRQHKCPPTDRDQSTTGQATRSQSQPQIPSPPIVQQAAVNQDAKTKQLSDMPIEGATSKKEVAKVAAPAAHPVVKDPTANKKSSSALPTKPPQMAAARRRRQTSSSSSDSSDDDQQAAVITNDKAPAKRPAPSIAGNASKLHRPTVASRKPLQPVENVSSSSSSEDEAPVVKKPTTAVAPPEANACSKASVQQSRHRKADSSDSSSSSSSDDEERIVPPRKSFFSAKELEAARRQPKPSSPMVTEFACKLCDYSMPVRQMIMAHLKTEHRVRESLLEGFYISHQRPRQEIIEKRRFVHRQTQCDGGECSECKQWRKRIKRMEKSLGNLVVVMEEANEKFIE